MHKNRLYPDLLGRSPEYAVHSQGAEELLVKYYHRNGLASAELNEILNGSRHYAINIAKITSVNSKARIAHDNNSVDTYVAIRLFISALLTTRYGKDLLTSALKFASSLEVPRGPHPLILIWNWIQCHPVIVICCPKV